MLAVLFVALSLTLYMANTGHAQSRGKLSAEEQLEIVNFYAADLERSLKRCQLERADFQAQGTHLARDLAASKAQAQGVAPPQKGTTTDAPHE